MPNPEKHISTKEKIVILFTIFLIRMLKPWEYDHQFTEFFKEVKEAMDEDAPVVITGKPTDSN